MDALIRVEIIATGHEVVTGEVVNTNAAWLAEQCAELGLQVEHHVAVDDHCDAIAQACREAARRAHVVLVTGGLGPTHDDCTLEAAAKAVGHDLCEHAGALAQVEEFYLRRGAQWREAYRKQAMLPAGAEPLHNAYGAAPGVEMPFGDATFYLLPGVPSEMQHIFLEVLKPRLHKRVTRIRQVRVLKCFGMSESQLQERVNMLDLGAVTHGFRITLPEVAIKLIADADSLTEAAAMLTHAEHVVREALGEVVFGEGKETLAGVVGGKLISHQASVAVAESCTGGQLAAYLTDVPGASHYFRQGFVTYCNEAKHELLGVPRRVLSVEGAVSRATAEAMAIGVRERTGSTFGVAITGIAGPGGGSELKPRGTVYIALATARGVEVAHHVIPRPRPLFKQYVAALALDMLRRAMRS